MNMGTRAPHYAVALRMKPSSGKLLEKLVEDMGTNKTAVLVTALHDLAKVRGVKLTDEERAEAEREEAGV